MQNTEKNFVTHNLLDLSPHEHCIEWCQPSSAQLFKKKDWMCLINPFDIIILIPRRTLGMCCFHIAQLMTHTAVQTLPFTLQLCYKRLGIQQRVTKNQKVYISIHNRLPNTNIMNHSWASNWPCRILKKNFMTHNLLDSSLHEHCTEWCLPLSVQLYMNCSYVTSLLAYCRG